LEQCLFYSKNGAEFVALAIYVANFLSITNLANMRTNTIQLLRTKVKTTAEDRLQKFLGVEMQWRDDSLVMYQRKLIQKLRRTYQVYTNHVVTPMETRLTISKSQEPNVNREFRSVIGVLLYLGWYTRLDICLPNSQAGPILTPHHPNNKNLRSPSHQLRL